MVDMLKVIFAAMSLPDISRIKSMHKQNSPMNIVFMNAGCILELVI